MGISLACLGSQMACCVARNTVGCCCSFLRPSTATRLCYSAQFFVGILLAWILMTWGYRIPGAANPICDQQCWSYLAVMRISLSLVLYHSLMSLIVWNVQSSRQWRARLHNGWWPVKLIFWLLLLVAAFQIPDFVYFRYPIAALVFSALFIVFQSMLLVDFAWSLAQRLIDGWEETERPLFKRLLLGGCGVMYLVSVVITILLFAYFGPPRRAQCGLNSYFTGVNLVLICVQTVVAVLPRVQELTPRSGLFQSGLLAIYTTYLTASAIISAPADDGAGCGQAQPALDGWLRAVGVLTTFAALGYYAFTAGSSSFFQATDDEVGRSLLANGSDIEGYAAAIAADGDNEDDEETGVVYSYSLFHLSFMMASFYMAMVLTDWSIMTEDWSKPNGVTVEREFSAVWVKAATSWLCTLLYLWTLVAPLVLPDRDFSI